MGQAKNKEEVLASSDALTGKADRMLKVNGGKVPNRAVKLGADHSMRRSGPNRKVRQKVRLNRFKARLSKATRMLDRSKRALSQVFVAGLLPGALYADGLTDFSTSRNNIVRSASPRGATRKLRGVHNAGHLAPLTLHC